MSRYHGLSGEQALAKLSNHLDETAKLLRSHQGRLDMPAEWRRSVRRDAVADAQASAREAEQAFVAWRNQLIRNANQTLAADTVGSAAEETAKLRREQTIQRLIQTARLQDERTGAQVVGGRVVTDGAARALAAEARRLFVETSDYSGALAHAEAAIALGVDAGDIRDAAQRQVWMADPDKASALGDLDLAERSLLIFSRDANAAMAGVLQAAAVEALDLGDDPTSYRKLSVGPSMAAKVAAIAVAERDGKPYEPPAGALASTPKLRDDPERSAGELLAESRS
ncbi:MAG: hypothetical protein AB1627_02525 [Chloroflexota bacterium]